MAHTGQLRSPSSYFGIFTFLVIPASLSQWLSNN